MHTQPAYIPVVSVVVTARRSDGKESRSVARGNDLTDIGVGIDQVILAVFERHDVFVAQVVEMSVRFAGAVEDVNSLEVAKQVVADRPGVGWAVFGENLEDVFGPLAVVVTDRQRPRGRIVDRIAMSRPEASVPRSTIVRSDARYVSSGRSTRISAPPTFGV